uniref:Sin3 histone deacetylase corepressor complex component SDS3 n=1 Tax=Ciona savignyi TaxID=51511 RepID=H2YWK3_CIOSA
NEDTDDASETDRAKREEATEIKEQMYREKLAQIKQQVAQLHAENHPEFCRKHRKLEMIYKERQKQLQVYHCYLVNKVNHCSSFIVPMNKCFNGPLSQGDKKKQIEMERHTMELTGAFTSSMEAKAVTRKLRRRANEPPPTQNEKRRKASPTQLNFLLNEEEIANDLKILNKEKVIRDYDRDYQPDHPTQECRLENGRLYFEKRWYHTGQPIFVDYYREGRVAAIVGITDREVCVRKVSDGSKIKIVTSQLNRGRCGIKRRTLQ